MSALPQKKLCWNCEGNVAREIDNCPYCGVYLQAVEGQEDESLWSPSYRFPKEDHDKNIPAPLYQSSKVEPVPQIKEEESIQHSPVIWKQIQTDVLPLLLLMSGSIFFLFGTILLLFAYPGTLTLQWKGEYSFYFLFLSLPALYFGWKWLQEMEADY
jgi:hypothetical protein